jgi:hypothetical protein
MCSSFVGICGSTNVAFAADPAPNWKLIQPAYSTIDTFVAAYNVKVYGATVMVLLM